MTAASAIHSNAAARPIARTRSLWWLVEHLIGWRDGWGVDPVLKTVYGLESRAMELESRLRDTEQRARKAEADRDEARAEHCKAYDALRSFSHNLAAQFCGEHEKARRPEWRKGGA